MSVCLSVCLSVRPSVTLVHCIQTAEDIVKLLSRPYPSSFLFTSSAGTQFQGKPVQQGRKVHWRGEILRFSTEIAVHLGNGAR